MDKRTIALVILLAIVTIMWTPLMDWLGFYSPPERPAEVTSTDSAAITGVDSLVRQPSGQPGVAQQTPPDSTPAATAPRLSEAPAPDSAVQFAPAETLYVETQTYVAALSTQGGALVSLKLKEYKNAWDNEGVNGQVEMIPSPERAEPQIVFPASELNLSDLRYRASHRGRVDATSAPQTVVYTYDAPGGATVERRFTFSPDIHSFTMQTEISDRRALGIEGDYQALWETGIPATELNQADDYRSSFAMGMYNSGPIIFGEEGIIFGDDWENDHFSMSEVGDTYWVGKRSKYFTAIMIPGTRLGEKAYGYGTRELVVDPRGEKVHRKDIVVGMDLPLDVTQSTLTDS
ncbi:MAG TPA: membrane protein insertase YidC, partial [candidate division Zixibacteria bacterium]|nr:membrane protein insertase YidC [candidate division Zixibacteria bacterium]